MTIDVAIHQYDQATTVSVRGRVAGSAIPAFERTVLDVIDGADRTVVIDCTNLTYISSSGLRVLVLALKHARAHQVGIKLICPDGFVRSVLTITGLDRFFGFESGLAVAFVATEAA
ncbi:putative Anti-sigma factor antagonist [Magnetospirillum sp. LM-5]|uniref:STAS domain-containing protein n=1 Tax=Magnetospirillum sp. LM-5 TaxID=2681466 RepID=UPI001383956D|nr:STAS domain-containing protein [Magnetospirillum sp. LM-5]CAA7622202.1 putative Anti-sigma factor antagonist [Magnetospirillum sp. LM-5]